MIHPIEIDPVEFGKAMGAIVKDAVTPLLSRLEAVERALETIPEAAQVRDLLGSDELKTLVDLHVVEAVAEYFAQNPVHDGKDGADGAPGEKGLPGEKGRDGLDLKDLFRADGGNLIAVMSDGTTKDLGKFVGNDGKDGLSFESVQGEYDSERGYVITLSAGDRKTELVLPGMAHLGFYREGLKSLPGQSVTHDGSLWIAKRETCAKPCRENSEDYYLAARKGTDAVQVVKRSQPRGPIKLDGSSHG